MRRTDPSDGHEQPVNHNAYRTPKPGRSRPELWGGIECSVVRVGGTIRNQVVETGHHLRNDDLSRIAELGIRTLRYPVVWETVSPRHADEDDWAWHDERLLRMRQLSLEPILGLVHHGSGPGYGQLLGGNFAEGLALHARKVAERYPWVRCYTPVNEPLTTARFSALYGFWHPHLRDHDAFLRAVFEQCMATVLAMSAIKTINSNATLVTTEDMGRCFSTPRLRYQADYENERRWLSLDLLCGRVDPHHPFHQPLIRAGITANELSYMRDREPVVDVIGINHYLTSDRYLDERLSLFPPASHGGNGRESYADIEAFRSILHDEDLGPAARLAEVWQRYGLPIAVTEVHNGAPPEEQVRWLMEVWRAAGELLSCGADIRAVTVWSIFGAMDWNSLLTKAEGSYENGVFNVRGDNVEPTLLTDAVTALASTGHWDHPVLREPGWWRRPERICPSLHQTSSYFRPVSAGGGVSMRPG